jgi:hypothetical protein
MLSNQKKGNANHSLSFGLSYLADVQKTLKPKERE